MTEAPLVIHDFYLNPDGGGRLAHVLARSLGADLWAGHVDLAAYPGDWFGDLVPHGLQALERPPQLLRWSRTAQFGRAFGTMPQQDRPWTVFSGGLSLLAHGRVRGPKVLYCHTPPRLLYDLRREHLDRVARPLRPALGLVMARYRRAYETAVAAMDGIVANSEAVRERIGRYLGREAVVVHPPIDTESFAWLGQEDFFLSPARLDFTKRVDVVVRAFRDLPGQRLKVVSGGADMERIRALAGDAPNIEVLGWVDAGELRRLTGLCRAVVYIPRDEDFGMSPVEAMAAGKPVIGVAEGGLLETVVPGRTGVVLRPDPGPDDLAEAVRAMTAERALAMREACEQRAALFGQERFVQAMGAILESTAGGSRT